MYLTHKIGEDEYSKVSGSGYAFFKWNSESGEIISSEKKLYTFGDVFSTEEEKESVSIASPDLKFELSRPYSKTSSRVMKYFKLINGDYIILHNAMPTKELFYSQFIVCLSPDGEIKWTKFVPYLYNERYVYKTNVTFDREHSTLITISKGRSENYESSTYDLKKLDGLGDVCIYSILDLETGEFINREVFEVYTKKIRLSKRWCSINLDSQKLVVVLQNNTYSILDLGN